MFFSCVIWSHNVDNFAFSLQHVVTTGRSERVCFADYCMLVVEYVDYMLLTVL